MDGGWLIYLAVVAVMSVVTFAIYGWDKWRARRGGWRVKEATLQLLALLGGWPGAMAGRRLFSHKTRKRSFTLVLWATAAGHATAAAILWWWQGGWG